MNAERYKHTPQEDTRKTRRAFLFTLPFALVGVGGFATGEVKQKISLYSDRMDRLEYRQGVLEENDVYLSNKLLELNKVESEVGTLEEADTVILQNEAMLDTRLKQGGK